MNQIEAGYYDRMLDEVLGRLPSHDRPPARLMLIRSITGKKWHLIAAEVGLPPPRAFALGRRGREILDRAIDRGLLDRDELAATLAAFVPRR